MSSGRSVDGASAAGELDVTVLPRMEEIDDDRRLKVNINERDLLCVNGCGFYGTPQWGNRCSKCWRAHQIAEKRHLDFAKNKTLLSFERFEERRKLSTDSRTLTLRNILRKSPSMHASTSSDSVHSPTSPHNTPQRQRHLSSESAAARAAFTEFLVEQLPTAVVEEVARQTKHAVGRIHELNVSPDELSQLVHTFYQYLSDKLNHSSIFSTGKVNVEVQEVMEEVEKFISICCYSKLFCPNSEEEVHDLSLQERIRSLHWVTAGFLEMKIDFTRQAVRDCLDEAVTELIDVNSYRRCDEKLACLVRCAHKCFDALKASGAPTSADEFLPVLIYTLLKGNPPLIQSNIRFIERFALPGRVMSGESGYFFTNLSCALRFVQNMLPADLNMTREEFEAYTSGERIPPFNATNCGCNQAIGAMEHSLGRVRELLERQKQLSERIKQFERRVSVEETELVKEVRRVTVECSQTDLQALREKIRLAERQTSDACSLTSTANSCRTSEDDDGTGTSTN